MHNTKILSEMIMAVAYDNISPSLEPESLSYTIQSGSRDNVGLGLLSNDDRIEILVTYPENMYFSLTYRRNSEELNLTYSPDSLAGRKYVSNVPDFETVEKHIKAWLKGIYQVVNSSALGIAKRKIQEEIKRINSRIDEMEDAPLNDAEKKQIQSALEVMRASFLEELNKRDKRLDQIEEELEQIKAKVAEGDRKGVMKSICRFVIRNKTKFIGLAKIGDSLGLLGEGAGEVLQLGSDVADVLNTPET